MREYKKGDIGLKGVATTEMRNQLDSLALKFNTRLLSTSKLMFEFDSFQSGLNEIKEQTTNVCLALPITAPTMLSYMVSNKLISESFETIVGKLDQILSSQSDCQLKDYLLSEKEDDFLFGDEKLSGSLVNTIDSLPYMKLSQNSIYRVFNGLTQQSDLSFKNVHSKHLLGELISAQFNASVSSEINSAEIDMFNTPDEERRKAATDALMKAMSMGGMENE